MGTRRGDMFLPVAEEGELAWGTLVCRMTGAWGEVPWEVLGRSTGGADPMSPAPPPSTVMVAVLGDEAGRAIPGT